MKTGPQQPREYRRRPLPADLKNVLQLQEELKKLEDAYAYISAGACRDLIRARRKDLQDLQVLREKDLLAFYCARSGLKAPEKIERIEEILDLYGEVSAEEAESNPGEGGKAFPRKTKTGQNAQEVQIEQNAQGVQAEQKKQGPQAEQADLPAVYGEKKNNADADRDEEEKQNKDSFLHGSSTGIAADRKRCPICGYPLQLRYKPAYGLFVFIMRAVIFGKVFPISFRIISK